MLPPQGCVTSPTTNVLPPSDLLPPPPQILPPDVLWMATEAAAFLGQISCSVAEPVHSLPFGFLLRPLPLPGTAKWPSQSPPTNMKPLLMCNPLLIDLPPHDHLHGGGRNVSWFCATAGSKHELRFWVICCFVSFDLSLSLSLGVHV